MRTLPSLVGAIALIPAAVLAQSNIQIPQAAQISAYGTSANFFRAVPTKWQCIYDSSTFTAQGVLSPINITQVSFQFGPAAAQPTSAAVTYPQVDVYLQPAAVDYLAQSLTYASNRSVAFPTTPNFSGPVTSTVTSVQGDYFITIPLTTPFAYDPSLGVDLLFEIEVPQAPSPATANTLFTTYNGGVTTPANLCNVTRSTASATATTGSFTGFVPIMKFDYGPVPGAATVQNLGAGCIPHYSSMYELFAAPANFDLQNSALTFIPAGGGAYVATRSGAYLPIGSVQAVPTALGLGDDAELNIPFTVGSFQGPAGPWTSLNIVSNGVIAELPGHPAALAGGGAPTSGTFLNAAPTAFYCLGDWDPSITGGGTVWYEESAGVTTITWDNVPNWTATPPAAGVNSFQFQLYPSGVVTIAFLNLASFGNNGGAQVGYSPGGPNLDPGSRDISAIGAGSVFVEAADIPGMALAATNRPVINTNWNLSLTNIDPTSLIGLDILGLSDPGINDLFFIGMPGCGLRASLDVTNAWFVTGPTHSYSFAVPNQPSLVGFPLYTTTATLQSPPQNGFGAMTSNGVLGTLGSI